MHVAVVGAGALGAVYGVLLSRTTTVTFVARTVRRRTITIERGGQKKAIDTSLVAAVPPHADIVLVTVGTEDLAELELAGDAPIVFVTPMLPDDWAAVRRRFGDRALAAMPNVIAYLDDETVRYWLAPRPSLIDEPRPPNAAVDALVRALRESGLSARLELGVHERNPATTACFIPIGMALAVAGSVRALADDEALLALTHAACVEGTRLGWTFGTPETGASFAATLATPFLLRALLFGLARWPEARFYAEGHFGQKLRVQHQKMARDLASLARNRRLPHAALDALAMRLDNP